MGVDRPGRASSALIICVLRNPKMLTVPPLAAYPTYTTTVRWAMFRVTPLPRRSVTNESGGPGVDEVAERLERGTRREVGQLREQVPCLADPGADGLPRLLDRRGLAQQAQRLRVQPRVGEVAVEQQLAQPRRVRAAAVAQRVEHRQRPHPLAQVGTLFLAGLRRGGRDVKHVIGELPGNPDSQARLGYQVRRLIGQPGEHRAEPSR